MSFLAKLLFINKFLLVYKMVSQKYYLISRDYDYYNKYKE